MLTLDIDDLLLELDEGTVKHAGASTTAATAKLYDVERAEARTFGDRRVKVACEDDGGNEIEVALDPDEARALARDLERLEEESDLLG